MDPQILVLVHVSTTLISLLGFYLFYKLLNRYLSNLRLPSLFLALYALTIGILYLLVLFLRFPTEENNIASISPLIPLGVFVAQATAPFFSAAFASLTIHPRYGKYLAVIPFILTAYSVVLIVLNPPIFMEAHGGITELVCHENTIQAMWITLTVSLIAPIFLLYYGIVVRDHNARVKGIILSASFFLLAYLIHHQENFGAGSRLYIRRMLIFMAIFLLNVGFTMPSWFEKIIKRGR